MSFCWGLQVQYSVCGEAVNGVGYTLQWWKCVKFVVNLEYLKTLGRGYGNPIFEKWGGVGVPRRFFENRFGDFGFAVLTRPLNPHHTRRTLFSEWARARERFRE